MGMKAVSATASPRLAWCKCKWVDSLVSCPVLHLLQVIKINCFCKEDMDCWPNLVSQSLWV